MEPTIGTLTDSHYLIRPLRQNNDESGTLDATEEGILDLLASKSWAIKLATEAARTVLSVDQIIVARQAGGPKPPGPNPVSFEMLLETRTPSSLGYFVLTTLCANQNWDED